MTDAAASSEEEAAAPDTDALWKPSATDSAADDGLLDEADSETGDRDDTDLMDPRDPSDLSSPWSSGSGVVFAEPSAAVFVAVEPVAAGKADRGPTTSTPTAPSPTAPSPSTRRVTVDGEVITLPPGRSSRRRWIAAVLVAAVAIAAVIVVRSALSSELAAEITPAFDATQGDGAGDLVTSSGELVESFVTEPFAGADRRRLPSQLDQQWSVDVAGVSATGRTRLSVLGNGDVIGVFDDGTVDDGQAASVVALLDGADGSELWRRPLGSPARGLEVLGSFGDVVVLERVGRDSRALLALSVETGETLWARETDDPGVHTVLEGTQLVVRMSFTENALLTFIDPATGVEVGSVPGRLFATDYLGTWYVRDADAISELDLRDGWNAPTPFETLWVDDDEPATVIGGRLIAIDDGTLEARGADGRPTGVATIGAAGSGGFAGLDTGANFTQLFPMVDSSFVVIGSRAVFGAELDENGDADVRWRASGTPIESRPSDRGLTLIVATEGGGAQRVIDASTGREIVTVELVPGSIDALQLVGNGVVVKRSAQIGFERVGLDLDGNRLWSLVGGGPLAIGSGVVVTSGPSDTGATVTSYLDSDA